MMSPKGDIRGLPGGRRLATSAVKGLIIFSFEINIVHDGVQNDLFSFFSLYLKDIFKLVIFSV